MAGETFSIDLKATKLLIDVSLKAGPECIDDCQSSSSSKVEVRIALLPALQNSLIQS